VLGGSPMNVITLLRRGNGPVWGTLKRVAQAVLRLHVPVGPVTRPLFRALYALHVGVREGLLWLLRFVWFEPLFRSQCSAVGRGLVMESLPYIVGCGKITLGDNVRMSGKPSFAFLNRWEDAPQLIIGDHSVVGHGCIIAVGSSVRIGKDCLLAGGVSISDHDGHPIDAVLRRTSPPPPVAIKAVELGDDVWIGAGARILKGVSIGDRSIVGAGAVVTKSVPADVIVAGNPARVIKSLAPAGLERNGACLSRSSGQER
jgi:acetyltransferase-like isoleucine patch superfamily enzyme